MNSLFSELKSKVFDKGGFHISDYSEETESQEYGACRFTLNGKHIICRNAKLTPKKIGQFVTFWKRDIGGPIAPFDHDDPFDFFIVNISSGKRLGLFIIPKDIAVKWGLVSSLTKEGKRAFRVYPAWDKPTSAQALRSQKWQLAFFYEVGVGELEEVSKCLLA